MSMYTYIYILFSPVTRLIFLFIPVSLSSSVDIKFTRIFTILNVIFIAENNNKSFRFTLKLFTPLRSSSVCLVHVYNYLYYKKAYLYICIFIS